MCDATDGVINGPILRKLKYKNLTIQFCPIF